MSLPSFVVSPTHKHTHECTHTHTHTGRRCWRSSTVCSGLKYHTQKRTTRCGIVRNKSLFCERTRQKRVYPTQPLSGGVAVGWVLYDERVEQFLQQPQDKSSNAAVAQIEPTNRTKTHSLRQAATTHGCRLLALIFLSTLASRLSRARSLTLLGGLLPWERFRLSCSPI